MVVLLLLVPYTWRSPSSGVSLCLLVSPSFTPPSCSPLHLELPLPCLHLVFFLFPCSVLHLSPYRIVLFTTVASLSLSVLENALSSLPWSMFTLFLFPSLFPAFVSHIFLFFGSFISFSPLRGNLVVVRCHAKERIGNVAEAPCSSYCIISHSWYQFFRLSIDEWKNNWFTNKG